MSALKKILSGKPIVVLTDRGLIPAAGFFGVGGEASFRSACSASICVRADNVARFVCESADECDTFSLPTIAPPFPKVFVEFCADYPVHYKGKTIPPDPSNAGHKHALFLEGDKVAGGWELSATLIFTDSDPRSPVALVSRTFYRLDESGAPVPWSIDGEVLLQTAHMEAHDLSNLSIYIGLFSVSLMHCRNVTMEPLGPRRVGRFDDEKKAGARWHVLKIDSIANAIRAAKGSDVGDGTIKAALHICRGHFKDYRKSGLFGKHKGVFWWDFNLRGSASRGMVGKEYEVSASESMEGA